MVPIHLDDVIVDAFEVFAACDALLSEHEHSDGDEPREVAKTANAVDNAGNWEELLHCRHEISSQL